MGAAEILSGICGAIRSRKALDQFHSELVGHFGIKHCFLVSSGKAALTLTLQALKQLHPERDEVVIPAFTCYSVPSSILRAGLKIRLCDLDSDGLEFDYAKLSALVSHSRILAVLPTHLFGYPSDLPRIRELIREPDITIIEDAAQAMGESLNQRKLGTIGDVGFFSLGRGKAFSTIEGGVILTDRDDIAALLESSTNSLPAYGFVQQLKLLVKSLALMILIHPLFFWIPRSLPFLRLGITHFEPHFEMSRLSGFQAGLARNWRERLSRIREIRMANAATWIAILEGFGARDAYFRYPHQLGPIRFPIRIRDSARREQLLRESEEKGAGVMPTYPQSIDKLSELNLSVGLGEFPNAEKLAAELVTLPTHHFLNPADVKSIEQILLRALNSSDDQAP